MNVGIVLSGGMAKGAYQIGALKAISDYISPDEIACMSCSSVGVLNGYSFVAGTLNKAEKIWMDLCRNNSRLFISQILRSSIFQDKIEDIYNPDAAIDNSFYCSLLDITSKNIVYKDLSSVDSDKVLSYLKASVSMPLYNKAVCINSHMYFDGAMIDNIPVYPLKGKALDLIICVYFDDVSYKFEDSYFDKKVIKITFPSQNVLKQSMIFRQEAINEMIEKGFSTTSFILDSVFAKGKDDTEHIYRKIQEMNLMRGKSNLRVTGDMLVTNFNRFTKRFLKQKIK